jgi:hypothetical protein
VKGKYSGSKKVFGYTEGALKQMEKSLAIS